MAERRSERLDQPRENVRRFTLPSWMTNEAFGLISEKFARFMGTAQFLIGMTVFVGIWLIWNTWGPKNLQFDPRDLNYTLLTLILSLQASYAAPLILLAQNRQEARDRLSFDEDRRISAQSRADTDFLAREIAALRTNVGELATRDFLRSEIRDQLRDLLAELEKGTPEEGTPTDPGLAERR